ncbi:MAG: hypothetical protein J2P16_00595 [Mycobacterium sp.]|nr:hypothetical protein [Mycobacterium sp.]
MNRSDLEQAVVLNREADELHRALGIIAAGAVITRVTLTSSSPPTDSPGDSRRDSAAVDTTGLTYPPQMTTAIQAQLQARYDAIVKQLSDLGVTTV